MVLIDCFVELIGYVSYFRQSAQAEQPNFEKVKNDIATLIAKSRELCRTGRLSTTDYELAQFAVFAWIDETILSSEWQEKMRWQGEQLQRVHFQTVEAGELFFDRLNELQPHQQQVREVYYTCLALGFSGRYCNPGDEFLLGQLKTSNLKLLADATALGGEGGDEKIFPEAYSDGSEQVQGGKSRRFTLGTLFGVTLPVMLFGVLYYIYGFVLSNVGENLLKSIH